MVLRQSQAEADKKKGPLVRSEPQKIYPPLLRVRKVGYFTSTTEFSSPKGLTSTWSLNGSRCQRLSTTNR